MSIAAGKQPHLRLNLKTNGILVMLFLSGLPLTIALAQNGSLYLKWSTYFDVKTRPLNRAVLQATFNARLLVTSYIISMPLNRNDEILFCFFMDIK